MTLRSLAINMTEKNCPSFQLKVQTKTYESNFIFTYQYNGGLTVRGSNSFTGGELYIQLQGCLDDFNVSV